MTKDAAAAGQISKSAAEIYDEFFVPALFGEWAGPLCDAAEIGPGDAVLDVACGTGATTREAARRVGPAGRVAGLDCNAGMLDVARTQAPAIEWTENFAESLPYDDGAFDRALCQFGLMFFGDRVRALREMRRILRPGGTLAVSVWDDVGNSPGYDAMIRLIEAMFGPEPADALRAPFVLGDPQSVLRLLDKAGLDGARIVTRTGTARFASIRDWVRTDVRGWTLADFIDDAGVEALTLRAEETLERFVARDGAAEFPAPAHIAIWTKE